MCLFQNVCIVFTQNVVGCHQTGHDMQEFVKTVWQLSWFLPFVWNFVVSINLQHSVCALKSELYMYLKSNLPPNVFKFLCLRLAAFSHVYSFRLVTQSLMLKHISVLGCSEACLHAF
jgi:hypothetical protein